MGTIRQFTASSFRNWSWCGNKSLPIIPKDIHWINFEPNPYTHPYLEREAQQQGLTNIELQSGSAEKLPVEDESIDNVVSTHVLFRYRFRN